MPPLAPHLLLGVGNGAVFAALALALVLTYRSSGVLNFATGAVALYAAYTYAFLRQGQFFIPIPGLPKTIDIGGELDTAPAIAVALAVAVVLGVTSYLAIFRPLRHAPPAARAVASVGLMVMIQGAIAQRLGTQLVGVAAIFPNTPLHIGESVVQRDRLYLAATVLVIALTLAAVMRFTRFGLATRAAAETEKGAVITGLSPDRIAIANWAISSLIAGLAGILIAPMVPLRPVAYTLFIVPALAAALLGQFKAIAPAVVGGLAIGMAQSEITFLQVDHPGLPQTGLSEMIPLALIFFLLVVRGKAMPTRGALITHTLGRAPRPRTVAVPALAFGAIAIAVIPLLQGQYRAAMISSVIMAVIALSMVVVTGYTGQISLAQLTLAGAGGYLLSGLTTSWGVPFPLAPLLAALGTLGLGLVVGLATLRARGMSVAVISLALAVALEAFWFRNSALNGGLGGARIATPSLFGFDVSVGIGTQRTTFGVMCVLVLIGIAVGVASLRRSRLGAAMLAVRANERSAAAAGINVRAVKLAAFGIGAFIAGIGGSLLAYQQTVVSAPTFTAIGGIGLFTAVYLAGVTSVSGGILAGIMAVGGIVYVLLNKAVDFGSWYEVVTGLALIVTVITNPEGLARGIHKLGDRWSGVRSAARPVPIERGSRPSPAVRPSHRSGEPIQDALLRVRNVTITYGGVVAVDHIDLDIDRGSIVGLIGPNGAGKTTLIDAISGFTPMLGEVTLAGHALTGLKPHQRVRHGLGRTFQAIELYDDLTVEENIAVGDRSRRQTSREPTDLFASLGLSALRHRPAAELSQGQRQLVSIARCLAGNPALILLDEPAAGLDNTESAWLAAQLTAIRDTGVTILLIDHDMDLILNICDRVHVLNFGSLIASGTPDEIRQDDRVANAYLGSTPSSVTPAAALSATATTARQAR
ncbi:branched-chain amino acid ABC transporter permease/ATP-binding protein [Nocardia sp. NBC_00565]|uniref:branched-chain amino acid ABC transporter permease/ATP-binding protein n=1 Tax=Nocardia sp. NBC_00565 TaxID=2975993 RepID=UPI002E7FC9A0|nr:branched-chain amino acid ABC transporter permease/ATP-binding protein [Nocardia sp. NBC_00565]WUC05599.1 branched-chain amino acid ABC transporter permease/ATP-binding protein [Nocardia sp. NBC_00565]